VLLGFGNSPEFFAALFGCFHAGVVAVPVDPLLATEELQAIADHSAPSAVFTDTSSKPAFGTLRLKCPVGTLDDLPAIAQYKETAAPAGAVQPDDIALLLYTSGTTGRPKGVGYSHEQLLDKLDAIHRWFGFDESFTSLCLLPTHFGHGLICNCLATFAYGGTLVIAPPFNLELLGQLWSLVERHGVNYFSSVPTVVRLLMQDAAQRPVRKPATMRFVTCASAPLAAEEVESFQRQFDIPLLNCYGLTETAGWSACSPLDPGRALSSVGKALHCEIRIVDTSGRPMPPGNQGEVQIKGRSVLKGYYLDPGLGGQVLHDGWFSTGDIGELDAGGGLYLHSRIKDLIIRAGKNIYPAEVDRVLMSHPEVAEACTVGLPDALLGETVGSCIVLRGDASCDAGALIAHARQRLAAYKCPQRIVFVERIPKTSRGKVNRSHLRIYFDVSAT